jgi:hypothetical protein
LGSLRSLRGKKIDFQSIFGGFMREARQTANADTCSAAKRRTIAGRLSLS